MTLKEEFTQYAKALNETLNRPDVIVPPSVGRTAEGFRSKFGVNMRFDLSDFKMPIIGIKRTYWKGVVAELLWFLKGCTNIKELHKDNCTIWDEWADESGDIGPMYGAQWVNFNNQGINQIKNLIEGIKTQPHSRRHIVTALNPATIPDTSLSFSDNVKKGNGVLAPCHILFQVFIGDENKLYLSFYQRSADLFLGVPFNLASYGLLAHMVAAATGYKAEALIAGFGDAHIYDNQLLAVRTYLEKAGNAFAGNIDYNSNPILEQSISLTNKLSTWDGTVDSLKLNTVDFKLINYNPLSTIKSNIAI